MTAAARVDPRIRAADLSHGRMNRQDRAAMTA